MQICEFVQMLVSSYVTSEAISLCICKYLNLLAKLILKFVSLQVFFHC